MRLLSHNLLMCNVKNCEKNNFPLLIEVTKSQLIECDFKKEFLQKLIPKLDWKALHEIVTFFGQELQQNQPTNEELENEDFLRQLHKIIMETHIIEGKLICRNCQRQYPIQNGIPNMILNDNEI